MAHFSPEALAEIEAWRRAEFEDFYRTAFEPLTRAILPSLNGSLDDARDVVQDAFVDLAHSWKNVGSPYAWMSSVCRRKVMRIWAQTYRVHPVNIDEFELVEVEVTLDSMVASQLDIEATLRSGRLEGRALLHLLQGDTPTQAAYKLRHDPEWRRRSLTCNADNVRRIVAREIFGDGPLPEPIIDQAEARRVKNAIRRLPPRQREVFELTLFGLKPADVAKRLGISANTARVNLHHANAALARGLGLKAPYEAPEHARRNGFTPIPLAA